jgi:steroid delta-isomerase-like uncharacterized protein
MGTEENKAIVRRFIKEAFNEGNPAVFDELNAGNYVMHVAGTPDLDGPDDMKHFVTSFRTAFPDLNSTIEDQIAEGDTVVTRWTSRGTHQGEFQGIPPTGKHVTLTGVVIDRIAHGKLAETWFHADTLGMMQQLGVIPAPEQAGA